MARLKIDDAKPGEVRHKIVSYTLTGVAVKAASKSPDFETDTTDPDGRFAGFLKGFAGRLMNIDRGLDIIFPGAFGDLGTFLEEGFVAWQHDWTDPIGSPLVAREVHAPDWGLYSEARISRTATGEKAITLINDKVVKKLSIGYRLKRGGYDILNREGLEALMRGWKIAIPPEKQTEVLADFDKRKLEEVWALTDVDLFEYSPVSLPMNGEANITGSKDLGGALDGLPFNLHPIMVVAAVKGLAKRLRAFKEIRETDKRKPSPAHVEGLVEVVAELEEAFNDSKTLLDELQKAGGTAAADLSPDAEGVALYNRFLALESRFATGAPLT